MKTSLTLLFLIGNLFYTHAQTQKLIVEVSFSGTRCNGSHGLCVVEPTTSKTGASCVYLNEQGLLVLEIKKDLLHSADQKKILVSKQDDTHYFVMEDTFVLNDELRSLLELPAQKGEIPKGSYKVQETEAFYTIVFPLK
jgi:hypothetical protein